MHVKKLLITKEKFVKPILALNQSIHLNNGAIQRENLVNIDYDGVTTSTTGHDVLLAPATFKDNYEKMRRTAAIIIPKDVGFIIAETGLTKDAVIIDAGGGSGGVTCQLAALCKRVYSYD